VFGRSGRGGGASHEQNFASDNHIRREAKEVVTHRAFQLDVWAVSRYDLRYPNFFTSTKYSRPPVEEYFYCTGW
jgi:hypothetical protein